MTDEPPLRRPGNPLAVTGFVVAVLGLLVVVVFGPGVLGLVVEIVAAVPAYLGYRRAERGAAHRTLALGAGGLAVVVALVCAVVVVVAVGVIGATQG